ncbi:hypothetical protein [Schinkia azotoformans]|nr:hypothetical protein [Schinkia azotoformans]MEC1788736.1 hypothetical protein [Schinkia azotoformans]
MKAEREINSIVPVLAFFYIYPTFSKMKLTAKNVIEYKIEVRNDGY